MLRLSFYMSAWKMLILDLLILILATQDDVFEQVGYVFP